jgi:hypothetical protein
MAAKLTKLWGYKVEAVQQVFPLDGNARCQHYKWFQQMEDENFLVPQLVLLSDEAVFTASENLTAGINDIGVPKIHSFHFVLLYDRDEESGEEGVQTVSQNLSSFFLSFIQRYLLIIILGEF